MNDRIVNILEQYDVTVLHTRKGRSAILCDTDKGVKIIREYTGPLSKLCVLEAIGNQLKDAGILADGILRNKDGALFVRDRDRAVYIVKDHYEGRECSVGDLNDCTRAVRQLAQIQSCLHVPDESELRPLYDAQSAVNESDRVNEVDGEAPQMYAVNEADGDILRQGSGAENAPGRRMSDQSAQDAENAENIQPYRFKMFCPESEYERYNRELKRVRRFLQGKGSKTDFEVFLLRHYPFFMEQAEEALEKIKRPHAQTNKEQGALCHGDFQYHNILFAQQGIFVMNYEKCLMDVRIRDFYLFFRKVMEKNGWNISVGRTLLDAYDAQRPLSGDEKYQLYCRLCYPERFRKVVSFYHNSGKAWIPGKNREKIEHLLEQETARRAFLQNLLEA